jgi:gas vesicle protein
MLNETGSRHDGVALKMFVGGLALGALVGGAVALLYAPMKGEDTRRMIKEKAVAAKDMIEEKHAEMHQHAEEFMADVKARAMDAKKRGENVIDCIKQA